MTSDVYAVILAGGSGTRFWPKSRHLCPKQLCRIGSDSRTMLENTLARLDGFIPPDRRLIVTHREQIDATRRLVANQCAVLLPEPEAKNTANALAMAALEIARMARQKRQAQPVMISLHADHLIEDEAAFRSVLIQAIAVARGGPLTLLGVKPTYPETGFGYIERGEAIGDTAARVRSFREKPDRKTAEGYIATGRFLWNTGLFVWRTDVLLDELRQALSSSLDKLLQVTQNGALSFTEVAAAELSAVYKALPKISIDHAVLETSANVAVLSADFGWQDVGSWDALAKCFPTDGDGNLLFGDGVILASTGTTVDTDGPFVAALGLKDQIVVSAGGAILVCPKDRAQDVKLIVEWLTAKGRQDLL